MYQTYKNKKNNNLLVKIIIKKKKVACTSSTVMYGSHSYPLTRLPHHHLLSITSKRDGVHFIETVLRKNKNRKSEKYRNEEGKTDVKGCYVGHGKQRETKEGRCWWHYTGVEVPPRREKLPLTHTLQH